VTADDHELPAKTPLRRQRRAQAAVALKVAGATYVEIADTLGYANAAQVVVAVEQELARSLTTTDREQLREVNGRRLERLLRSVWGKAIDAENPEHLAAVRTGRELIDRYCRLYGLDAPTEIVVHSPTTAELERWVAAVAASSGPGLVEYDVLALPPADEQATG
jgi:hypothetical protein